MQLLPSFGEALIRNGDFDEAKTRLTAMIPDAEKRHELAYLPELYRVLGEARIAAGDRQQGMSDLKSALKLSSKQGAVPLIQRSRDSLARIEHHQPAEGPKG